MAQAGAPEGAGSPLSIRLLGEFGISLGERPVGRSGWRLRKARTLVKLLALAPGCRLHREEVMAMLWPDLEPRAAANNFYQALHCARKVLDTRDVASHLHLADEVLVLDGGEVGTDVQAFEAAAAHARAVRSVEAYRAAVELYRGDLLPEDPYEEWALRRREQLRELQLSLLFDLARLCEARGEGPAAIEALQTLTARDPANERAHSALMRAYALKGDRAKALRQYEALRQVLRRELEVEPDPENQRLFVEIASGRFPRRPQWEAESAEAAVTVVPRSGPPAGGIARMDVPEQGTSFVGRRSEIAAIGDLLRSFRLVTLTGAPGCGKTRLALEVARAASSGFAYEVRLVDLAPLTDPDLLPQVVAAALEIPEQPGRPVADTLAEFLRGRFLLLVLDNCEHVRTACADLAARLLQSPAGLRILATSREPLSTAGEATLEVHPLPVPDTDSSRPGGPILSDSVQLFVDRAGAVRSSFRLTAENAGTVDQICRRLDGIPLALELAASQLRVLSVEQIAARLDDALAFGASQHGRGGQQDGRLRHQTLKAALDWSCALLNETEQAVLRRLGVFPGTFSLDAVEAVVGWGIVAPSAVLPGISRLVRASLLMAEPAGDEVRYRLLETVRRYAWERLREAGEEETVRSSLVDWCVQLAGRAEAGLGGVDYSRWVERLAVERDTFRAALESARERDRSAGTRLAGLLWQYWEAEGQFSEGRTWSERMLDGTGMSPPIRDEASARALLGAGTLAGRQGDLEAARPLLEESLRLFREVGDRWGIGWALDNLGMLVLSQGDLGRAQSMLEESLELFGQVGDRRGAACTLDNLGWAALLAGDQARAQAHFEQALAIFREIGDRRGMGRALGNLGNLHRVRGDVRRARALFKESAQFCQVPLATLSKGGASLRGLIGRLQVISWSSFSGVATVPCVGVCAGFPLLTGTWLSFSLTVPLWAIIGHLILLPVVIPLNGLLLFINFRRHRQPWGLAAGVLGGLLTLAALASHFEILSEGAHDLIWPGGALLIAGVLLDWIAQRRFLLRPASPRPAR